MPVVLIVVSAMVMEPVSALLHRSVMHGWGWGWHRSHHQTRSSRFERNDLFPVTFAAVTFAVMLAASVVEALRPLLWIGVGAAIYGAAYLVVHDVCIHQRLGHLPIERWRYLRWVRDAHRIHHLFSGAPYGFLVPVVPAELRARAADVARDPFAQVGRSDEPATAATFS